MKSPHHMFFSFIQNILRKKDILLEQTVSEAGRAGGFRIQWRKDRADSLRGVIAAVFTAAGPLKFFIADEQDYIQRHHLSGRMYEQSSLRV